MANLLERVGRTLDRLVAVPAPQRALRRSQARRAMAYYESARPDRKRKYRREDGSGDTAVRYAGESLREQARHLEQNLDVARNALAILVANTVGPNGIQVEPQPRRADGTIHTELAERILRLYRDWSRRPEVTQQHSWASAQRLLARSWLRDGDVFAQELAGPVIALDHGTRVPYSLELLEADMVPLDYGQADPSGRIIQGVELNGWRRPVAYYVTRQHPGTVNRSLARQGIKRIPAERMLHARMVDRIHQVRGVSVFASVLSRLDDIKDIEESARIAEKVAASMAAAIKKGSPELYDAATDGEGDLAPRNMRFRPGMIFDDLLPGESIEMIDTGGRPNTDLTPYLDGQFRRAAGGVGCTGSSLSKNYNGTYSSQRQELVEGWGAYQILANEFTSAIVQPVYERLLAVAVAAGEMQIPADVDRETLDDALYIAPQMPWIDPLKEANAWAVLESNGYASAPEIIRRRGQTPADVLDQEQRWRDAAQDRGLTFNTMTAVEPAAPEPEAADAQARR